MSKRKSRYALTLRSEEFPFYIARLFLEERADYVPKALQSKLLGHIRARDWKSLSTIGSDIWPDTAGLDLYFTLAQIRSLFKKNSDFADDSACEHAARINFNRSELICRITNKRLDYYSRRPDRLKGDLLVRVNAIRRIIDEVMGDVGVWKGKIPDLLRVTSGATASNPRASSRPFMKIRRTYRCTPGAWPYIRALARFYGASEPFLRPTNANRIAFVPKDSFKHRTIACEPEGNLPLQLSIDAYLKQRLCTRGIDLSKQTRNQELARDGSLHGHIATIDLSMASDTLALNTILWLFPEPWVDVLMALRSPCYKDGLDSSNLHRYAKFSSMGNGFTFVLETVLFYAIVKSTGSNVCCVYGDDIICDVSHSDTVIRLLHFFGFMPNPDKTFSTGFFRESCGTDWYKGISVRPYTLLRTPRYAPELCHFINNMLAVTQPGGQLWAYFASIIERFNLHVIPFVESTTAGIHIDPTTARRRGLLRTSTQKYGPFVDVFRGYAIITKCVRPSAVRGALYWLFSYGRFPKGHTSRDCWVGYHPFWLPFPYQEARVTSELKGDVEVYRSGSYYWHPPVVEKPVHLYCWTDYLCAQAHR